MIVALLSYPTKQIFSIIYLMRIEDMGQRSAKFRYPAEFAADFSFLGWRCTGGRYA